MVELMECDRKIRKIGNNGVIRERINMDDNEISQGKTTVSGCISNKVPRLNSEQASESMIKKARVSVRTRSEASMVSVYNICDYEL